MRACLLNYCEPKSDMDYSKCCLDCDNFCEDRCILKDSLACVGLIEEGGYFEEGNCESKSNHQEQEQN